jgi:hypothetical protein
MLVATRWSHHAGKRHSLLAELPGEGALDHQGPANQLNGGPLNYAALQAHDVTTG